MEDYFQYLNAIAKQERLRPYKYRLDNVPVPPSFSPLFGQRKTIKQIKTRKELLKVFDVNNALSRMFKELDQIVKVGANVESIDNWFYNTSTARGYFPSMLGYQSFPKTVSISVNEQICHCLPRSYVIKSSDLLTVDTTLYNGHYHTDCAQSYMFKPSKTTKLLYDKTKECLDAAIAICKPGLKIKEIANVINAIASHHGLYVVENFSGHGIGEDIHMKPYIPNNLNNIDTTLKPGFMFTIEPILTYGSPEVVKQGQFEYVTKSGKKACHFERTILITEGGHQVLNGW